MELAINDYQMIDVGDRILVCLSGGDDSYTLLKLLTLKKIYIPNDIYVMAAHIDLGFNATDSANLDAMESYLCSRNIDHIIEKSDIGSIAHSPENRLNPCFLCSKMRRKRLLEIADRFNCSKIAFGHHKDDIVETLLINIFFGREISTMKPKQELFNGKFYIIRPLAYLWEKDIKRYARQQEFPTFTNGCPTSSTSKRKVIKDVLRLLEKDHHHVKENIYKSMKHVKTDYLL